MLVSSQTDEPPYDTRGVDFAYIAALGVVMEYVKFAPPGLLTRAGVARRDALSKLQKETRRTSEIVTTSLTCSIDATSEGCTEDVKCDAQRELLSFLDNLEVHSRKWLEKAVRVTGAPCACVAAITEDVTRFTRQR